MTQAKQSMLVAMMLCSSHHDQCMTCQNRQPSLNTAQRSAHRSKPCNGHKTKVRPLSWSAAATDWHRQSMTHHPQQHAHRVHCTALWLPLFLAMGQSHSEAHNVLVAGTKHGVHTTSQLQSGPCQSVASCAAHATQWTDRIATRCMAMLCACGVRDCLPACCQMLS